MPKEILEESMAAAEMAQNQAINSIGNDYKYGFRDEEDYIFKWAAA